MQYSETVTMELLRLPTFLKFWEWSEEERRLSSVPPAQAVLEK